MTTQTLEAVSLAAELKEKFDTDAELFAEGKGIFDVLVNSELIYSKYKTDRFPESGEVIRIMESR